MVNFCSRNCPTVFQRGCSILRSHQQCVQTRLLPARPGLLGRRPRPESPPPSSWGASTPARPGACPRRGRPGPRPSPLGSGGRSASTALTAGTTSAERGGSGKSTPAEGTRRTHAPRLHPGFRGPGPAGGGGIGGAVGGAGPGAEWVGRCRGRGGGVGLGPHTPPDTGAAQARGGEGGRPSLPGNRVQQSQPSGRVEASRCPPAGMCAAEVDQHVAQRYLLKRRLGKGVSPATCRAGAGPMGGLFCPTLPGVQGSRPVSSTDWTVALGKPPSPSGLSVLRRALTAPTPRKPVAWLWAHSGLRPVGSRTNPLPGPHPASPAPSCLFWCPYDTLRRPGPHSSG